MTHEWVISLLGGVVIGASTVLLMGALGRIAGISGIASALVSSPQAGDRGWRIAFVVGLIAGPLLPWIAAGDARLGAPVMPWPWMVAAGLLVGFGTKLGGGCTSGHGVCGIARLSPRSMLATVVFMLSGFATVFAVRHGLG